MVRTDTRRIVWDAAKDLPNGFKCTNVLVTCRDERILTDSKRYMVVDLSSGPSGSSFAVSYTNQPPSGGWTEEHMLQKLVLRRIDPGTFQMGSPASDVEHVANETYHKVALTKPYYLSVFELTGKQYSLIRGGDLQDTKPVAETLGVIRGFDMGTADQSATLGYYSTTMQIVQKQARSANCWPASDSVDGNSVIGRLRSKTSLKFDLPTEAQWEFACRAGATTPLYIGLDNSEMNRAKISGTPKTDPSGSHLIYVGNYQPNSWGLYDMNGNIGEWCLDIYCENLGDSSVSDPRGGAVKYSQVDAWSHSQQLAQSSAGARIYYNGQEFYSEMAKSYTYTFKYTAFGIPRVVKGTNQRCAARMSAITVNTDAPIFTSGLTGDITLKANYTNPKYGLRLALTVD